MLDGVTPFPAEFAARYTGLGYWEGRPLPRSHNDYLYNSKIAAAACEIGEGDVLLDVLPIEHNLPLGCPGLQGFLLSGGTVVLAVDRRDDRGGAA
jgi:non-ribosomal peptide synthetase component E (peptide arylation enzyme)